jgi:hypothetical protein
MKRISLVSTAVLALGIMFFTLSASVAEPAPSRPSNPNTAQETPEPSGTATRAIYIPPVLKNWPTQVPTTTATPTLTPVPSLKSRVSKVTVTLPQSLATSPNWCTWGWCTLSPRLYHEPLSDGRTMVGWTDASGNGHISIIGQAGGLDQTYNLTGRSVRGLVTHDDGTFAVLLWDPGSKVMWLSKRQPNGSEIWAANLDNDLTSYEPTIGDSRLSYGNDLYAAYFGVHGDSGWPAGNQGDQFTYVSHDGIVESGGWDWGCSHSLAALVGYHPVLEKFIPVCASDCYSSKGILANVGQVVYAGDGDCAGLVSAQLGQVVQSASAWKLVFNAMARPGYEGQGIGLASVSGSFQSSYVWLTNTNGQYERDPVLARLGSALDSNRYLVGWMTTNDQIYRLGVVDGKGVFLTGPEEVSSAGIAWGNRDDSFRTRPDGSVSWVRVEPTTGKLHLYRFDGSIYLP